MNIITQVLSDEQLRANYDANGKDGVDNAPKMDSGALFAMIFGSEKFEPLVGELQLASQMNSEGHEDPKLTKFKQKKRQIQCALNLVVKLQPYIDSDCNEELFRSLVEEEAKELSASAFGSTLVSTIGTAYHEFARQELDSFDSVAVSMRQASRGVASRITILSAGVKAAVTAREVSKLQKLKEEKGAEGAAAAGDAGVEASSSPSPSASAPTGEGDTVAEQAESPEDALLMKKIEEISGHMFTVM
jgi:X-domain of DnaJ-containing